MNTINTSLPSPSDTILAVSESIGYIKLSHLIYSNTKQIAEFLKTISDNKEFTLKVLYNQIHEPIIEYSVFQKLRDSEIEYIGNTYIDNEFSLSIFFTSSGLFYDDFRNTIERYIEDLNKRLKISIEKALNSINLLNQFSKNNIYKPLEVNNYLLDSIRRINTLSKEMQNAQLQFIDKFKPIIENNIKSAIAYTEQIKNQYDQFNKWFDKNKSIYAGISSNWDLTAKKFKFAEEELKRYKWFLSPSLPADFFTKVNSISKKEKGKYKEINNLIITHFSENNWQELESMVYRWKDNPLFKRRMNILLECVLVLQNSKKSNPCNAVIPTLISQIDGFLTDYLNSKGMPFDCDYDDFIDNKTLIVKKVGRKSQFQNIPNSPSSDDIAKDIFLNILFQKSRRGQKLKTPFNFNRHKIIHGEKTNYGRKDYLIRAFMLLDYLAYLK